ncbi:MAG: preprotein translocase subunit SecE [Solirubrobacteraceae bacterium]|nr:preprotein translocase subunit SecE [Solirubrobacteraceae bacterium]
MSRNRERAKERKERLRKGDDAKPGADDQHIHRENVPGELEHASYEVEEAEASIVAGADGEVAGGLTEAELVAAEELDASEHPEHLTDIPADEQTGAHIAQAPGAATTGKGGPRFVQFLRASWAELQRVQWPDRRQVGQGTAVTLGFVVVAGLYLGAADKLAQELVDLII